MKKLRITAAMAITALLLAGCDKEEQKLPDPIINVDNEAIIELPPAGGTASFPYRIENSVENGYLTAEPSESDTWMSDFTITDSKVSFSVEANETEESREGTISLIYTYGENKTVNAVVNVSQQPGEEPVPTITITTEEPLALAADGGSYTIEYEITDPAEDGSISADAGDAGWITDINCDTEGVITFSVAANDTDGERQATITVTYTYNGTETVSESIDAVQEANEPPVQGYDYEYEMIYINIINYGGTPCNYYITMSDTEGDVYGTARYVLDIYANSDTSMPPAGTYTMTANGGEDMTASSGYSSTRIEDESGNVIVNCKLAEGTITISYEGSTMILDAVLTDTDGNIHHATYN